VGRSQIRSDTRGRDFDPETSLYFYRARYVDSSTGSFLSEDPLRFAGDGPNFYAYTLNNPLTYVDSMGTSVICPSFFSWCVPNPPNPPTPGLPGTWGGPDPGGWVPNAPARLKTPPPQLLSGRARTSPIVAEAPHRSGQDHGRI
jgi:RHS repeat-associated protein